MARLSISMRALGAVLMVSHRGFTLVQKSVASGKLTERLNWTITALGVGAAVGAWAAGLIADSPGGGTAFLVAVVAGGAAVIVAACGRGKLRTHRDKHKELIQRL